MTQEDRPLVVVGYKDDAAPQVHDAASAAGVPITPVERCEDLSAVLSDAHPLAILLPLDSHGAADACAHVRRQVRFAQVPIFGVARELSDLSFAELFVWGGDDLVALTSPQPMARRLRMLRSIASAPPHEESSTQRQAVVAGADATWRAVMGRALLNGGFAVRFAATAAGLENDRLEDVSVVVVADERPEGPLRAMAAARARGLQAACILVVPPKRMAEASTAVRHLGRVSVADGFAPPENVLFLVNELLAPRGVDKRGSPRILYGSAVAFRAAGRNEDEIGFSYNVSEGGLYVRTLAPLEPAQEVWLEMWPPRSERRVRLAGTVAWRRPFGPNGHATVPAGFGVCIRYGLAGDLERWRAGYEAFAATLLGADG